ncbi:NAD-binding protein [Schizopora paradoxa]|uniref:NAD-binding protein n=1 Tax=Schizopora paradoxa TaxID=27342 RepID=A0A0H2RA32_9AGAM|nr:NAD-binding protein [Schizopora paradoxa]
MASSLSGKKILIVGGTSGIGFSVAKFALLDHASEVVVASSTKEKVDAAVSKLRAVITEHGLVGKADGLVVDATKTEDLKEAMAKVGELDHLVWTSVAGPLRPTPLDGSDLVENKSMFDLQFWGLATAVQVAKIRPGGSITATSSTSKIRPHPSYGLLCALNGTISTFARGLAVDLAPVRVNAVCPGLVKTELWDGLSKEVNDHIFGQALQKSLVKHIADADEIADAYLFCMKCRYVTGQTIVVDGGAIFT